MHASTTYKVGVEWQSLKWIDCHKNFSNEGLHVSRTNTKFTQMMMIALVKCLEANERKLGIFDTSVTLIIRYDALISRSDNFKFYPQCMSVGYNYYV